MTRQLCHQFFQQFELDRDLFADPAAYKPYTYDPTRCDDYYDRYVDLGRIHWAIMLDDEPIGELVLKNVDRNQRCCTMGISMKSKAYQNKGYGTQAEVLALEQAFTVLDMDTVYADALLGNVRSQHVLQKVGFIETHCDEMFRYYRCDRSCWNPSL